MKILNNSGPNIKPYGKPYFFPGNKIAIYWNFF